MMPARTRFLRGSDLAVTADSCLPFTIGQKREVKNGEGFGHVVLEVPFVGLGDSAG